VRGTSLSINGVVTAPLDTKPIRLFMSDQQQPPVRQMTLHAAEAGNQKDCPTWCWKPHDRIFIRLDKIPKRDGRTDGERAGDYYSASALRAMQTRSQCRRAVETVHTLIRDAIRHGWARDVKAWDRDETETLTSRDRDETGMLASPTETRPRRDVCSSRDVIETLKYKFYWLQ